MKDEDFRSILRQRRAQDIWRRHLRSYNQPAQGRYPRHVVVVRLTPTGQVLRFVRGMGAA